MAAVLVMNKLVIHYIIGAFAFMLTCMSAKASVYDGSRLWLPQSVENNAAVIKAPKSSSATINVATAELRSSWTGAPVEMKLIKDKSLGRDGFIITPGKDKVTLTANSAPGLLYGAYRLLAMQATGKSLPNEIREVPSYDLRILNHWDNLDRTIERGYSGSSIWVWDELPATISPRYKEYARANAAVGINGVVLNNVNASSSILSAEYLHKVKAIADIFRPYGIKVYLSANFAAPMQLDSLPTADPLDRQVIKWWKDKASEIYRLIPDFGGFLVKANSEGQPGPCDFDRSHAQGANMMARALKPHGGIVMWRAFVYSPADADRAKQAYIEFQPLDGQFDDNVIVQIKNGPVDFQPREPYSPLFGAMPSTDCMVEFQITQEYLGHSNHLAYLAPMWKEFFSYVNPKSIKAVAGVANVGDDTNWTGHPFAQANWYAFGRLAWNPALTGEDIADEWLSQTIFNGCNVPAEITAEVIDIMMRSREAVVDYMMPMGLHHLFAFGHHYGPEPWCAIEGGRPDWMPSYYHRADSTGIGFDRSSKGSNAIGQYPDDLAKRLDNPALCPEEFLLWFHHLPWEYQLPSGDTLWDSLCRHYERGVVETRDFQRRWEHVQPYVDPKLFDDIQRRLKTQVRDAIWWKDGCLLYFQELSLLPFPDDITPPVHNLDDLKKVNLGISNFECPTADLLNRQR